MAKSVATIHIETEATRDDFIDCLREQQRRLGFELTFSQKGRWRSVHSDSPRFPGEAADTALQLSREFVGSVMSIAFFGDELAAELFIEGRSRATFSAQPKVRPKFSVNAWVSQGANAATLEDLREAAPNIKESALILADAMRIPESTVLIADGEFSLRKAKAEPDLDPKIAAAMKAALAQFAKPPPGKFEEGDDPVAQLRATLAKTAAAKPKPRPQQRPTRSAPRFASVPAKPAPKPIHQKDKMSLPDIEPVFVPKKR